MLWCSVHACLPIRQPDPCIPLPRPPPPSTHPETKFYQPRPNGSHVQHLRNSCVLLSEKGAPLGNRIKGCLGFEFNKPRWRKIGMLSKRLY